MCHASEYRLSSERARFELVTHWLVECVGRHHVINGEDHVVYNIDNQHQCFNERPRTIIRPFADIDYFFGCIRCGKYHFCYQNSRTCDSVAPTLDINNDRPTCAYSGKSIRNANNEVIGTYRDTVQFLSDSHTFHSRHESTSSMFTTSVASSASTNETRRLCVLENMALRSSGRKRAASSSSGSTPQPTTKKQRRLIDKQDMTVYFRKPHGPSTKEVMNADFVEHDEDNNIVVGDGELEMEPDSDAEDEQQYNDEVSNNEDAEMENINIAEHDCTIRGIITRNRMERQFGEQDDVDAVGYEDGDYACSIDGIGGGGTYDDEHSNDEGGGDGALSHCGGETSTRMKNRHNNTAYWDCYYAFLFDRNLNDTDTETEQEESSPLPTEVTTTDEEPGVMPGPRISIYAPESRADVFTFDASRLSAAHIEEVEAETRRIINILLRISVAKPLDSYQQLVDSLTRYYHRIIVNIIQLVYHSPYIYKLALNKHEKHEKQGKSSYSSKITVSITDITPLLGETTTTEGPVNPANPIAYQNVHDLLCPKKICASLMLQMLTDRFYLDDSMTNHIYVWVADPWLSHLKSRHLFDKVIVDYNIITDPLNGGAKPRIHVGGNHRNSRSYENLFFKKDLTNNSNTIRMALTSYNRHPLWLSTMIYK